MTPERFETLAEAFGGDVARWPPAERDAAAELMTARPDWAQGVLARARGLDAALDAVAPPRADAALAGRILAAAPRPRRRWTGWLVPAGMGAGLAAACAAGVLAGAQVSARPAGGESDAIVAAIAGEDAALSYALGEGA